MAPVALAFAVLQMTNSPSALGLVLAAEYVPQVVLTLYGGVLADRLSRSAIMVVSNAVAMTSQGLTAVLVITGSAQLWHLAALAAVTGTAVAFFGPAAQGIIPLVVGTKDAHEANALLRMAQNAARVGGPALGGILVAVWNPGITIALDAVTFAVAALCLARLKTPIPAKSSSRLLGQLREGWSEFWSRSWLWAIVLQYSFVNLAWVAAFQVLGPVIANSSLGGAASWGLISTGLAAGLLVGGAVALLLKTERPLVISCVGTLTKCVPLLSLAVTDNLLVLVAATFVAGIGIEIFIVNFTTTMQTSIDEDKLGRISSYDIMFGVSLMPVGYLVAGPVEEAIGLRPALGLFAGLIALTTVAVLMFPSVRGMRSPAATPAAAG